MKWLSRGADNALLQVRFLHFLQIAGSLRKTTEDANLLPANSLAVAKLLMRKKANEKRYLQKLKIFAIIFIESEKDKSLKNNSCLSDWLIRFPIKLEIGGSRDCLT